MPVTEIPEDFNFENEFNRLLDTTKQFMNAVDFDKKKLKSFAELSILKNAVDHYEATLPGESYKVILWPDFTSVLQENYVKSEWDFLADDYMIVNMPINIELASVEFDFILTQAMNNAAAKP